MMIEGNNTYWDRQWETVKKRIEMVKSVSPLFVAEMEIAFWEPENFQAQNFQQFELQTIFDYLKESHTYYLEISLPKIENTLQQLQSKFGNKYVSLQLLLIFIDQYKKELVKHIKYEERVLFLFVEQMLEGNYSEKNKDFVLNHFLHTHNDNVIIQLDELKKDIETFDEGLKDNLAFRILFHQLTTFQHDLKVHGLIEDTVFIDKILQYTHLNFNSPRKRERD